MGTHDRTAAKTAPISSSPLFPAVVALWFAALFGLGSLAVRPALIEGLVLHSHLDLILPAAAPPLGITARILIALLLAALGAVIGLVLTRRLTRPAPTVHERKRGARDLSADEVRIRTRDAHPDAPARRPISAHEELGADEATGALPPVDAGSGPMVSTGPLVSTGLGAMANRRRALAIIQEDEEFVPHDMAPLPGTSADQPLAPAMPFAPAAEQPAVRPPASSPMSALPLDWSAPAAAGPVFHAPPLPSAVPAMIAAQRQEFQPAAAQPAATDPAAFAAEPAAPEDTRQIFGQTPPAAAPDLPRQIFGQIFGTSVEDGHAPQDLVRAAGFQTSVFDTLAAEPLFGASAAARPTAPPLAQLMPPAATSVAASENGPAVFAPLPSPATLDMTDLAARLAEAMRRRRLARSAAPAGAGLAKPVSADLPADLRSSLPALTPAAVAEPAATLPPPPVPIAMPAIFAAEPPFAPVPARVPAAAAAAAAIPRFAAPVPADLPAATGPLPAAMRPLVLDDFAGDDDDTLDLGLLPPRQLGQLSFAAAAAHEAPLELTAEIAPSDDDDTGSEQPPAGDDYASLLGLTPPRAVFARIDEPQPHDGAIEPVVIFPGQAAPAHSPFAAAFAPQTGAPDFGEPAPGGSFRRFDAPASAGQGQPIAPGMSANAVNPAEADQALRAALANLQRMSGAA